MKGCVLLTVLWFIFCTEAGAVNTTDSIEISNVTGFTETSSAFMSTEASTISTTTTTTTGAANDSMTTTTDASNNSMTTTIEALNTSTTIGASNDSMTSTTDTSNDSMTTTTIAPNTITTMTTIASNPSTTTTTGASNNSMTTTTGASNDSMTMTTGASNDSMTTTTGALNASTTTETSSGSVPTNSTDAPFPTNATTTGPLTCADHPCQYAAACIDLFQSFSCQCPYGFYYMNTSGCQQGKIFPGAFTLMQQYDQEMQNIRSEVYAVFYHNISNIFHDIFKDEKSYQETIIISIKPSTQALKRLSKAEAASNVNVTLINLFDINTSITPEEWKKKVNSSNAIRLDRSVSQCAVYGCDGKTTTCREANADSHPTCECHPGLAKKYLEDKACSFCNSTECSPEKNQFCSLTAENVPVCRCQPGFQKEGDKCQKCAFGYSGEDCKEVYLAALTGVSVACGVVIIVLIGVFIYKITRGNKEPPLERASLLQNAYSTPRETTGNGSYSNPAVKQRMFPRVQAGNPAAMSRATTANQGGNIHEAGTENKAYVPERDYDDNNSWLEMTSRDRF